MLPAKAAAGGGGITVGSALAILIIALWWKDASPEVAVALTTVLNAVLAIPAVYFTPHGGNNASP